MEPTDNAIEDWFEDAETEHVLKYLRSHFSKSIDLQAVCSRGHLDNIIAVCSNWDRPSEAIYQDAERLGSFLREHGVTEMEEAMSWRDYVDWFWRRD